MACELFPSLKEVVRAAKECIGIGFSMDDTKQLTQGKTVQFTGELYSDEHKRSFNAENIAARLETDPEKKNRLRLIIDSIPIGEWFKSLARIIEKAARKMTPPKKSTGRSI